MISQGGFITLLELVIYTSLDIVTKHAPARKARGGCVWSRYFSPPRFEINGADQNREMGRGKINWDQVSRSNALFSATCFLCRLFSGLGLTPRSTLLNPKRVTSPVFPSFFLSFFLARRGAKKNRSEIAPYALTRTSTHNPTPPPFPR